MNDYQIMDLKIDNKSKKGIKYKVYVLPKGNPPIYRGDTRLYNDYIKPKGSPVKGEEQKVDTFLKDHNFFTLFLDEAEIYGVPYQYETIRPLFLLAIDKHSQNQNFYDNAPDNIKTILDENYGWTTNKRDSDGLKDQEVANYICSLGLDGYASQPMESVGIRPNLPSEILLCNSNKTVGIPLQVTTSTKMIIHTDKYNTRYAAERGDTQTISEDKPRTTNIDVIPITGSGSPGSPNVTRSMNFDSPGSPNVTRSMNFDSPGSPNVTRSMNFDSPGSPNVTRSMNFDSPGSPNVTRSMNLDSPGHAVRNLSSALGPEKSTTGGKRTNKKRKLKRKTIKKRKSYKKRKTKK